MGAQEDGGIGQQSQTPSQPQTVQEGRSQSQLVLFKRLRGFNPRPNFLNQVLRGQAGQGQQTKESFVLTGRVGKLARTAGGFPTLCTKLHRFGHPKLMLTLLRLVFQPTQGLALVTDGLVPSLVGSGQGHVRTQTGDDGDFPAGATQGLELRSHEAHVAHHDFRPPLPALLTVMQAGRQQFSLEKVAGRHPTDQRDQTRPRPHVRATTNAGCASCSQHTKGFVRF